MQQKDKCILLPSVVIHTYIYSIRTTRVLIYQELHKITKQGKYDKFNVTVHLHMYEKRETIIYINRSNGFL